MSFVIVPTGQNRFIGLNKIVCLNYANASFIGLAPSFNLQKTMMQYTECLYCFKIYY
jgi:hypothetical protein